MEQAEIAMSSQPSAGAARGSRRPLLLALVAAASVVYLAGLVYYARVRPIDGDEAYYSTAARLVREGKTPYQDFSYPQAPLLPYIYSWIWAIHPHSLVAMRFLSAAFGGLAVFLWGVCLLSFNKLSTKVALATFVVVLLNPYWVSWNVVVKTFALTNLLMSIATICLFVALHSDRVKWYFLSGLALGACASVRLLYAPLAPLVLVWLLHREWRTSELPHHTTLTFLGGATCGLLPIIFSLAGDPGAFIFNNVQYHTLLASHESLRHTVHMYLLLLIALFPALYLTAEVVVAIVGGLSLMKLRKKHEELYTSADYLYFEIAFLMFLVYTASALIPFPSFDQYFDSPLLPFLIPFVAEGLRALFASGKKWVVVFAVLAPILFFRDVSRGAAEYAAAGESQLSSYHIVTQAIEANSNPDDVVLSFWPGYIFESGRRYFPGSENHFAFYVTDKLSPAARARYHIVSMDEILRALSARSIRVVVTSPWILEHHFSPQELKAFRDALEANYSFVGQFDSLRVYRSRSDVQQDRSQAGASKPRALRVVRGQQVLVDRLGGDLMPIGGPVIVISVVGSHPSPHTVYETGRQIQIADFRRNRSQCGSEALRQVVDDPVAALRFRGKLAEGMQRSELRGYEGEDQLSSLIGAKPVCRGDNGDGLFDRTEILIGERRRKIDKIHGESLSVCCLDHPSPLYTRGFGSSKKKALHFLEGVSCKGTCVECAPEAWRVVRRIAVGHYVFQIVAFEEHPNDRTRPQWQSIALQYDQFLLGSVSGLSQVDDHFPLEVRQERGRQLPIGDSQPLHKGIADDSDIRALQVGLIAKTVVIVSHIPSVQGQI